MGLPVRVTLFGDSAKASPVEEFPLPKKLMRDEINDCSVRTANNDPETTPARLHLAWPESHSLGNLSSLSVGWD